ncbi:preprotein translocase subunit SecA [Chloroflexota bacterium]
MFKWLGGLLDSNEKELKRLQPILERINSLEPDFEKLGDGELLAKTAEFKHRFKDGSSLDELLPEAFAAVREAAKRTIGQRHYDVQLMGGITLHQGKIAEMRTGEGKTLVATLPLYLNSLTGRGCHLATVNDYLARRDPYWMGPIYHALGVSVAGIYPMQNPDEYAPSRLYDSDYDSGDNRWEHFRPVSRKEAYDADITYGTSSEFGFDYLRDNMVVELSQCVQRPVSYAIVDEVDNLLIDEARTPLIISAPDMEAGQRYQIFARLIPRLREEEDYVIEEKTRSVSLTDDGISNMEKMLRRDGLFKAPNLYDPENQSLIRYLDSALKANTLYRKDRDYVVQNGQVILVDEFTGRLMYGRRFSEGLHQALEAKEHVKVQQESRTYATITIQNYFRMYDKLAGMTGTAITEAEEFFKIYKLEVTVIPTNKPMIREDFPDQIYKNEEAKFQAVVREIKQLHQQERPVLVGTVSIEKSEMLGDLLKRQGISYQVLNAKLHEKEASIIAQAGEPGAVTVATNMAGRGVDIVLGGSPEGQSELEWQEKHDKVVAIGGLHITGTERHEARRIDNQLRGRAGRQGDSGSTRFYVSLEDDIMRRFGGDRIKGFMNWAGMDEKTPIENTLVNKSITDVQRRVEGHHFDMRKHLVEYDDVVNKHREVIYGERRKILSGAALKANILSMIQDEIRSAVANYIPDERGIDWDINGLLADVATIFPLPPSFNADDLSQMKPKQIEEELIEQADTLYGEREKEMGADNMRVLERLVMLRTIDTLWVDHLTMVEYMRQGIGLQAMAQRDPLVAYKREGHRMFENLMATIQHDVVHTIYRVGIVKKEAPEQAPSPMAQASGRVAGGGGKQRVKAGGKKVGRNDPCPCGSGKKYKHCCGR